MEKLPIGLSSLLTAAIGLLFSPLLAAADSGYVSPTRTAGPRCAKLVCQRRLQAQDRKASGGVHEPRPASPVRVRFGIGAGAFYAPVVRDGFYPAQFVSDARPGDTPPDFRPKISGAGLSLGVSLEQELAGSAQWRWGLEERLALVTVVPLDGSSVSSVAGVTDLLLSARESRLPLRAGIGPSFALARLHVDDENIVLDKPALFAGGAAALRWEVGARLSLELAGHLGTSLNYDGDAAYRDVQLMVGVPL